MSTIEWTDTTWNPIVGCSKISPECDRCYAATAAQSPRLQQFPQYSSVKEWDGTVEFVESQILKPLGWKSPKIIFVCSMSDLFHENVPDSWRDRIFGIIASCRQHRFQILTKRTERMYRYFNDPYTFDRILSANQIKPVTDLSTPFSFELLPNIILGTTAGCQSSVDERSPWLYKLAKLGFQTFYSCEPLLEQIDLGLDVYPTSWVITGAESGRGARVMNEDWVRNLRDQCISNHTPFFYKQNFSKGKKVSTPLLDGKQWVEMPSSLRTHNQAWLNSQENQQVLGYTLTGKEFLRE